MQRIMASHCALLLCRDVCSRNEARCEESTLAAAAEWSGTRVRPGTGTDWSLGRAVHASCVVRVQHACRVAWTQHQDAAVTAAHNPNFVMETAFLPTGPNATVAASTTSPAAPTFAPQTSATPTGARHRACSQLLPSICPRAANPVAPLFQSPAGCSNAIHLLLTAFINTQFRHGQVQAAEWCSSFICRCSVCFHSPEGRRAVSHWEQPEADRISGAHPDRTTAAQQQPYSRPNGRTACHAVRQPASSADRGGGGPPRRQCCFSSTHRRTAGRSPDAAARCGSVQSAAGGCSSKSPSPADAARPARVRPRFQPADSCGAHSARRTSSSSANSCGIHPARDTGSLQSANRSGVHAARHTSSSSANSCGVHPARDTGSLQSANRCGFHAARHTTSSSATR